MYLGHCEIWNASILTPYFMLVDFKNPMSFYDRNEHELVRTASSRLGQAVAGKHPCRMTGQSRYLPSKLRRRVGQYWVVGRPKPMEQSAVDHRSRLNGGKAAHCRRTLL